MGLATCADINQRAMFLLQDSGLAASVAQSVGVNPTSTPGVTSAPSALSNVRWTVPEVLKWISDAQRAIVLLRPNSYNYVATAPMVRGVRQTIPVDGWLLLTANANWDMATSEYGRAITLATFDQMNRQFPNWRSDAKNKLAYNYMFDLTDQKAFYVWPPNDGSGALEMNYSRIPPEMTDMAQPITLDDIFIPPMTDYVLMRASMKDAEFGPGLQYAGYFQQLFQSQVFAKDSAEKEQNPDAGLPPTSNR